MTVAQLIEKLQALPQDLTVMSEDLEGESTFEITKAAVDVSEGEFPGDWNMPEGYEYVKLYQ